MPTKQQVMLDRIGTQVKQAVSWETLLLHIANADTVYTEGLDLAKYQDTLIYSMVPETVKFAIIKLTEGERGLDPLADQHIENAVLENWIIMFYHFFRVNLDPVAQALHFWNQVKKHLHIPNVGHVLFGDHETFDGGITGANYFTRSMVFHNHLKLISGNMRTGIYTSPGFWNGNVLTNPTDQQMVNRNIALWAAHWIRNGLPTRPAPVYGWGYHFDIWQYIVEMVANDLTDRNRFNGDEIALANFANVTLGGGQPMPYVYPTLPTGRVISVNGLNVRKGASTSYPIVKTLLQNQTFAVMKEVPGTGGTWAHIGHEQYCAIDYYGSRYAEIIYPA